MVGRAIRGATDARAFRVWTVRVAGNARRLRAAREWSQERAAEECGMAARLYQAVEAGSANLTIATLSRLCAGFRVDPVEVVRDVPAPVRRGRGRPPKPRA